jgi:hypothetical protein
MDMINKAILQDSLNQYQRWKEFELSDRIRNAGKKDVQQKWREFLDMMEFWLMIKPEPSAREQKLKVQMLNYYYNQIQYFEKKRAHGGKSI